MKKISEVVIEKTVHRPFRDDEGNLQYEELSFAMHYHPAIESHFPRLWAKLIDISPFFFPALLISGDFFWSTMGSLVIVIVYGTIAEHIRGATLGKTIMKLKVLDDYGNYPSLMRSLARNALATFNLSQLPGQKFRYPDFDRLSHRYHMNLNNEVCSTYVVNEEKVDEIRVMLK